jgi:hypothetical protein
MSKKIFNGKSNAMFDVFKGQLIKDNEIKTRFGIPATSVDSVLRVGKQIFLFAFKWDKGVMSVNNINQYFRSCNVIMQDIQGKHPEKQYVYYKVLFTMRPVVYQDILDAEGKPKFYNFHLSEEELAQSVIVPEELLMDRLIMKLYNGLCNVTQLMPHLEQVAPVQVAPVQVAPVQVAPVQVAPVQVAPIQIPIIAQQQIYQIPIVQQYQQVQDNEDVLMQ